MAKTSIKDLLKRAGAGLITGAADDDPSGIATYSQAGATFGLGMLWTAVAMLPFMVVVQSLCAKVGMVSGQGLAGVLRKHYSKWLLYPAVIGLVFANTVNAGTDISAIASALNMFVPIPISVMVIPIALIIVALQIWGSYKLIVKVFKWLTLSLFGYIIAAFMAKPNWSEVLWATIVPHPVLTGAYITMLVALLGTTISPYLFFWQASEVVEDKISAGRSDDEPPGATDAEIKAEKIDTVVGMTLSNTVAYFVILASASTLFIAGKTDIQTAADAAQALRPLAGDAAGILFAVGIIGTGLLGVPVLTGSSAYAVAETFGWKAGLSQKPKNAISFYSVIAVSTIVGGGVNLVGINPMRALFWTAVINGVIAAPMLVLIMLISNNKKIMGKRTPSPAVNILGWLAALIMFFAGIGMFLTWDS